MSTFPILLNLEVQNSFDHPRQTQLLAEEVRDMVARIEDTIEFEESDVFLSQAFEHGLEVDGDQDFELYAKWIADLSRDFPDLVLAMDASEWREPQLGPDETLFRWYFKDGRRQVVKPYLVVPDFDPDDVGQEIK